MGDPIVWAGFVMAAGLAGAAIARSLRGPAASGALVAGLLFCWALPGDSIRTEESLDLLQQLGVIMLGFLAGAELDPGGLMRRGRRLAARALAQGVGVALMAWLAGLAWGLDMRAAVALGAAAAAASPIAMVGVASEARARGAFTQELLALSSISLLAATAVVSLACAPLGGARDLAFGLLAAPTCGLLMLMPLSRMASRGAILTCAGLGFILIAGVSGACSSGSMLPILSVVAGFVACGFIPNRALVLEALRDMAFPCVIGLFAISGCVNQPSALVAAPLLVAARGVALLAVEAMATGASPQSVRAALAQLPMAGLGASGPAAILIASGPSLAVVGFALTSASALSHVIGMTATRWALRRSGEAALADRDPDAWRAAMR